MHASTAFSFALAGLAIGAGASPLQKRFDNSCTYSSAPERAWTVQILDDDAYDNGGCGAGFLDNFRGRCGDVTSWGCNYEPNTDNAVMNFITSTFCSPTDISAAISASSYGEIDGLPCTPHAALAAACKMTSIIVTPARRAMSIMFPELLTKLLAKWGLLQPSTICASCGLCTHGNSLPPRKPQLNILFPGTQTIPKSLKHEQLGESFCHCLKDKTEHSLRL
ncbi:hypothetical protein FH972_021746 [Carpinus fangiana]|uniref:Uncharacterized protein n=1 Tax=Carpinus fangiana TaxID=176857 RepID=A0A5N6KSB2_9ROSI|nr:hypothetical protein FH972_021746 [Carpinus fangiana]